MILYALAAQIINLPKACLGLDLGKYFIKASPVLSHNKFKAMPTSCLSDPSISK